MKLTPKRLMATIRVAVLGAAAISMAAISAEESTNPNVGKSAPSIKVSEWVAGPKIDIPSLSGKAYVIEFWATWCGPCRASIPHINELAQCVQPLGIPVMGLSDESPEEIAPFVKDMDMVYSVGVNSGTEGLEYRGIPFAAVIGADSKVVWAGHPMEPGFEEAVFAQVRAAFPDKTIVELAEKGKLSPMYAALVKNSKSEQNAQAIAIIKDTLAARMKLANEKDGLAQYTSLRAIAEFYEGVPGTEDLAARLATMREAPELAAEIEEKEIRDAFDAKINGIRDAAIAIMSDAKNEEEGKRQANLFYLTKFLAAAEAFITEHPKHPLAEELGKALPGMRKALERYQDEKKAD